MVDLVTFSVEIVLLCLPTRFCGLAVFDIIAETYTSFVGIAVAALRPLLRPRWHKAMFDTQFGPGSQKHSRVFVDCSVCRIPTFPEARKSCGKPPGYLSHKEPIARYCEVRSSRGQTGLQESPADVDQETIAIPTIPSTCCLAFQSDNNC